MGLPRSNLASSAHPRTAPALLQAAAGEQQPGAMQLPTATTAGGRQFWLHVSKNLLPHRSGARLRKLWEERLRLEGEQRQAAALAAGAAVAGAAGTSGAGMQEQQAAAAGASRSTLSQCSQSGSETISVGRDVAGDDGDDYDSAGRQEMDGGAVAGTPMLACPAHAGTSGGAAAGNVAAPACLREAVADTPQRQRGAAGAAGPGPGSQRDALATPAPASAVQPHVGLHEPAVAAHLRVLEAPGSAAAAAAAGGSGSPPRGTDHARATAAGPSAKRPSAALPPAGQPPAGSAPLLQQQQQPPQAHRLVAAVMPAPAPHLRTVQPAAAAAPEAPPHPLAAFAARVNAAAAGQPAPAAPPSTRPPPPAAPAAPQQQQQQQPELQPQLHDPAHLALVAAVLHSPPSLPSHLWLGAGGGGDTLPAASDNFTLGGLTDLLR